MKRSCLTLSVLGLLVVSKAHASTDINGMFDARSGAMGGTGVAYLDSAAAIPTNPSLLDQIGKLTISADLFVIAAQPEAPYTVYHLDRATGQRAPYYESVRSPASVAPLPFLGAAYRITDRVVIGLAAYPVLGQGTSAKYHPAPDEYPDLEATNKAAIGLIETGVPVSIRILDNLSLGLMWRATYMTQSVSTPVASNGPPAGLLFDKTTNTVINADVKASGWNFTGFQIGLFYKALPNLRFGFSYRSKVTVDGKGTTTTKIGATPMVLATEQGYTNPQAFRTGLAWSALDNKLLIAADFKYLLYAEAYKEIKVTTTNSAGKQMVSYQPAYWKNSFEAQLGAEYKLTQSWFARAGYALVQSATNPDYALAFFAPPGYSHLFTAGLGVKVLDQLNVDASVAYVVLASRIDTATMYNAGIGNYSSHGGEFSLSATYHL